MVANALMFRKDKDTGIMQQLKERQFVSVRLTDDKKYSKTIPVE